ncbi:RNA dependent RNA polymerase-domain-containing protein [Lasiosphaeria miniovina]|uniref:RNA-dependent RNA polymerase n=1 Tax=Lasiosphaeria miniovina TaxID=1954250 RepID=A0AA40DXW8_9PEZI|nr:RNA dependent RNA polymerase-domain-containing protein [Lasiosphaeria miniovina]KAK0717081.1 RNA dependent RNA polymerase-domain-containing protein [Lasiosphaeria miniovina]
MSSGERQFRPLRQPPVAQPTVIPPGWARQRNAQMIIRGVPSGATPYDIYQFFSTYSTVVYIGMDDSRRNADRTARVRFEPPPSDLSFIRNGRCTLQVQGRIAVVSVEFPRQQEGEVTIRTPLGNPCPATIVLSPLSLRFGVSTRPETFMPKKAIHPIPEFDFKLSIDFKHKMLVVAFPVDWKMTYEGFPLSLHQFRMKITFNTIKDIYRLTASQETQGLVITVSDPPTFWRKRSRLGAARTFSKDRLFWDDNELWERVTEINRKHLCDQNDIVSLDEDYQLIDTGRWTSYWIDMDLHTAALWSTAETKLQDWNIKTTPIVSFNVIPEQKPQLWKVLGKPITVRPKDSSTSSNDDLALLGSTSHNQLRFDVRYQLEVCISQGILSEYDVGHEFVEKLIELSSPESLTPDRARLVLEYAADRGNKIYNPMDLFDDNAAMTYYPSTMNLPDHCELVRKAVITPTRIYFNTPTVETTNRVVRQYKHVRDNFMRVQFTDEKLKGRIHGCTGVRDDSLYRRVHRVLKFGIKMGQWYWRFLAFGNSQLRENGAFFFCEPEGDPENVITCGKMLKWMGRFSHITVVAKHAARIGQCFSTTRRVPGISAPRIVKIPDVQKGKYCFTDGVGKISGLLARFVAEDWDIISPAPSAYQFRMGGCKGVLVVWPDVKGTEVHIRKSQEKFFAEFNGLEVVKCSQFSNATLNRQIIMILSCLGVPDQVFVDMMKEQLTNYDMAIKNKLKAVELLTRYIDESQTTPVIASMVLNGFMESRDPFCETVLQLWRSWSIKALKEKAKLIVEKGAFVLGCVDETGTLRGHSKLLEGQGKPEQNQLPQIFIQVPNPDERNAYKIITGLCIVGRNPSLHPGDIRVVEAVDVPALRHIRDAIVFPLVGDRDIPSMCSGGDLDGDDFFVIWDEKLIPPSQWDHPPMDFSPPPPVEEKEIPTTESLMAFFVLYMKNNNLGLIAHAHLAMSDYEDKGPKSHRCLKLAELHSQAVDYVKTGVAAVWSRSLEPPKWPHFMEKNTKRRYHSGQTLGQLYDMVRKEAFDSKECYKLPFDSRILKKYRLDNELLKKARRIKSQYDVALRRVMGQLEVKTEFEIWTTFIFTKPSGLGSDYKLQEKVRAESASLKQAFRDMCITEVGSREFEVLGPFAAAMYQVTSEEVRIALYEARQTHVRPDGTLGVRRINARSMPLISFPWIFDAVLGRIATGTTEAPRFSPAATLGGHNPGAPGKQKHRGHAKPDRALMDYTITSDGHVIHRGEILHLFRHDDDEYGDDEDGDIGGVEEDNGVDVDVDVENENEITDDTGNNAGRDAGNDTGNETGYETGTDTGTGTGTGAGNESGSEMLGGGVASEQEEEENLITM